MIDWVSIVRHSRRRFSNYMYGVPNKARKRRKQRRAQQNGPHDSNQPHSSNCSCCWTDVQKSRYAEDDMPPPPSPPHMREVSLDTIVASKHGSLERVPRRETSLDRETFSFAKVSNQTYILL
ncbi:PREDICTED: uncharacterized protein LOC108560979 [Nicrophorus vespilloides]|uniref:Uncharacterized protein LOC108560979 n=1 Tax=Nicrophorus vespilloides TaxID=110193 RepID=A0ABM1MI08_NICVS|nr:PREDICTED: uncharacterized protein LOC108560979 [Nicrophorus vespilloides]